MSTHSSYTALSSEARKLIYSWLGSRLSKEALDWIGGKNNLLSSGSTNLDFYLTLATTPRHVGKQVLELTDAECAAADQLVRGWQPNHERIDQLVRVYFLLLLPSLHSGTYQQTVEMLVTTAEMGELVAFCRALPLLPHPEQVLTPLVTHLLRHNIIDVFKAICCNNPFPAHWFNEHAFNQMVLKAAFNNIPFDLIYGLEQRQNEALSRMLADYVAERRAAGRSVDPSWEELAGMKSLVS